MPILLAPDDVDDEPIALMVLSGSDRGKRIRVMVNTLIHRGPTEPREVDEVRLFAVNVGVAPARLWLNDGRTAERVHVIPGRSEIVPIRGGELLTGERLTGRADLKNIYVWGRAIRRREPPPALPQRWRARLALAWLDLKARLGL